MLNWFTIAVCLATCACCAATLGALYRQQKVFEHVPGTWVTGDGRRMDIADMTEQHMANVLRMFGPDHPRVAEIKAAYLARYSAELQEARKPSNHFVNTTALDTLFETAGNVFWLVSVANHAVMRVQVVDTEEVCVEACSLANESHEPMGSMWFKPHDVIKQDILQGLVTVHNADPREEQDQ
jgi:hypothetical protein